MKAILTLSVFGFTALRYGNEFMVNHVPLVQGENTITVTATDAAGRVYNQSLMVTADIPAQDITATPLPEASLAPYDGELRLAAPVRLKNSTVALYGPGGFVDPPDHAPSYYAPGQASAIKYCGGGTLLFSRKWYTFHSH